MRNKSVQRAALAFFAMAAIAGCSASKPVKTSSKAEKGVYARNGKTSGKEYFSEAAFGVKASPRVSNLMTKLPRGGGRDQVGKPYQVRGKWYHPQEEPGYKKTGGASWYGDAFHGRLTANGEIYDMTHLSAAHPTMPLPSYARVTNKKNGSSVIVRVNDRGPYAHGRIIDLSRKAAELLDYTHDGVATVQVEYLGRARMDGRDDQYLLASYRPASGAPAGNEGLPPGVMMASATGDNAPVFSAAPVDHNQDVLLGPVAGELGYAPKSNSSRLSGLAAINRVTAEQGEYVLLGTYRERAQAKRIAAAMRSYGRVEVVASKSRGKTWQTVNLHTDGRYKLDDMLRAAWANGAVDAMTVHE